MSENKAAIYCRLSVEDLDKIQKGDDSESIQNQGKMLAEYAESQGFPVYGVYSDDNYSGLDGQRPAFNKMIGDAENGCFNIILCKTQSRFTRDMEMVEKYIHGLFPRLGIRFISLVDNIDTSVKGNKKARQIYGLVNEWYCEDLSENIRAVFKKKMRDGEFIGSFAPFGYMKGSADRHKLVIDEPAAAVVREIFSLYLNGNSCEQIAGILTQRKVETPTVYKKNRGLKFENPNSLKYSINYGVWSGNSINRILKNRTYVGALIQGRQRKISYKDKVIKTAPESEWIVIENNHNPIILQNEFETVQMLLKSRRMTITRNGTRKPHVLSGKVFCADCLGNMTISAKTRKGGSYLRCRAAYKTGLCTPHTIELEKLIGIVETRAQEVIAPYISRESPYDENKGAFGIEGRLRMINEAISQNKEIMAQAYIDKVKGVLAEDDFITVKKLLSEKALQLEQNKSAAQENLSALKADENNDMPHPKILKLTHEIANRFIESVFIGERHNNIEQRITVNWKSN